MKKITIFGGSGFVGSYLVSELARSNYHITVVSRSLERAKELQLSGNLGQISVVQGDIRNTDDIIRGIGTSKIVINLAGVLDNTSTGSLDSINHLGCRRVAEVSAELNVKRFIHFSALVCCEGETNYGKSKIDGENAVKTAFPKGIIIRPGIVFGEEDNFINLFIRLGKKLRILPLPSSREMFQPVYVSDLVQCVSKILQDETIESRCYTVVGPKKYTLREICSIIQGLLGTTIVRISLPQWIVLCEAALLELPIFKPLNKFLSGRSNPIITREQVRMLKYGSTSTENALQELDIPPTFLEEKLKCYIKTI